MSPLLFVLSTVSSSPLPAEARVPGWVAVVLVVGAVAGALHYIKRVAWPALRGGVHVADRWTDVEIVTQLAPLVEEIRNQFKNNGGSSLRDVVDTLCKNVVVLGEQLSAHADQDTAIQTQLCEDIKRVRATLHDVANSMTALRGESDLVKQLTGLLKALKTGGPDPDPEPEPEPELSGTE